MLKEPDAMEATTLQEVSAGTAACITGDSSWRSQVHSGACWASILEPGREDFPPAILSNPL